ncbi:hypothetical protein F383_26764 [Gossypium arboreum]|uniref:Uncharacterized protein n=1 Tax=Gossypium arboreum TaxID=29729 RepID=A0A0B0P9C6_GOSAR|nr:hypothetical protein F383_26764 [Gossypium arboreum]
MFNWVSFIVLTVELTKLYRGLFLLFSYFLLDSVLWIQALEST